MGLCASTTGFKPRSITTCYSEGRQGKQCITQFTPSKLQPADWESDSDEDLAETSEAVNCPAQQLRNKVQMKEITMKSKCDIDPKLYYLVHDVKYNQTRRVPQLQNLNKSSIFKKRKMKY